MTHLCLWRGAVPADAARAVTRDGLEPNDEAAPPVHSVRTSPLQSRAPCGPAARVGEQRRMPHLPSWWPRRSVGRLVTVQCGRGDLSDSVARVTWHVGSSLGICSRIYRVMCSQPGCGLNIDIQDVSIRVYLHISAVSNGIFLTCAAAPQCRCVFFTPSVHSEVCVSLMGYGILIRAPLKYVDL